MSIWGGAVPSIWAAPDDFGVPAHDDLLVRAVGSEPTPEFAAMVAEEYRLLLDRLGGDVLRKVAVLRMEGYAHRRRRRSARLLAPHRRAATLPR